MATTPTEQRPDNEIGSTVEIRFTNLTGSVPLKGKVDTGADICSLHATEYDIKDNSVTFICPELSANRMTVPLTTQQLIKTSDGGKEYRPVVTFNVKVNGRLLQGIEFNLNDRGNMKFPVLVGKNLLVKGGYKIDPRLDEDCDDCEKEEYEEVNFNASAPDTPTNSPSSKGANGIVHIYKLDDNEDMSEQEQDDLVDRQFSQKFMHVHDSNNKYIIRFMSYAGKKLNPNTEPDAEEIIYLMNLIQNDLTVEDKDKVSDFTAPEREGNDDD